MGFKNTKKVKNEQILNIQCVRVGALVVETDGAGPNKENLSMLINRFNTNLQFLHTYMTW